jgi:hypothetical protein
VNVAGAITPAFDREALKWVEDPKNRYRIGRTPIRHVFVAIDPAAGGQQSKYAAFSAIYTEDGTQVVRVAR